MFLLETAFLRDLVERARDPPSITRTFVHNFLKLCERYDPVLIIQVVVTY